MEKTNQKINSKDFIELEFTARVKDGEIFDSNIKENLEKMNVDVEKSAGRIKPLALCIGEGMFLKGVEDFLIDKEIGKQYDISLSPEMAFGKRNPELVKMVPMKVFKEQQVYPQQGMTFNFDGNIAKILSVSGGRVIVDFNNPLAGKDVIYTVTAKNKIETLEEKVKALMDFLFRKEFKFRLAETEKKLILEVEKPFVAFASLFKDKFKGILDLDLEVKEIVEVVKETNSSGEA